MKKIIGVLLLLVCGDLTFGEINVPYFGNNNMTIDADTTFIADMDSGATGLLTEVGVGLWFEFTPYSDRNISPQRDALSVSLKMANSAFYAWRGYDKVFSDSPDGAVQPSRYGSTDSDTAMSVWFNTFIAELAYNQYWIRIAGIEPEVTLSQASIKSVFDPIYKERGAIDKNSMFLPLFHFNSHYNPNGVGISSIIGRDLVNLNRREVEIAGNVSFGMKAETFDLVLKTGSWKTGEENVENSWIGGGDFIWRPDLVNQLSFSLLGAVNYGTVDNKKDAMADPKALIENPVAVGLGYEYRIDLPKGMVIKPYVGVDFVYETNSNSYDFEVGGGLQWFLRGTGAQFKRNTKTGGVTIGDVELPAAFILGVNVNKDLICNAIISFNESPHFSPIPNFGGFLMVEMMNIAGKEYTASDGITYNDFLYAGVIQLEYLIGKKVMPYIYGRYMPAVMPFDLAKEWPVYNKDDISITSKLGCRFTPFEYFYIDFWYERTDVKTEQNWNISKGLFAVTFGMRNYY
jgi:hypothetical protein